MTQWNFAEIALPTPYQMRRFVEERRIFVTRADVERHDDDCPPCQRNEHHACKDNPEEGMSCGCAEGGHL